jgi:hypothetical protein
MAARRELVLRQALENPLSISILARLLAEYNSFASSGRHLGLSNIVNGTLTSRSAMFELSGARERVANLQ